MASLERGWKLFLEYFLLSTNDFILIVSIWYGGSLFSSQWYIGSIYYLHCRPIVVIWLFLSCFWYLRGHAATNLNICRTVFLGVSVCQSLPYTYCTYAMLCTMHVFSAFIWPFHCIHIAVTKAHVACRRPKSFVRRCTSETILTSADAACRRPVSFLRMMHHCLIPISFQPKDRLANLSRGRRHAERLCNWFPSNTFQAV